MRPPSSASGTASPPWIELLVLRQSLRVAVDDLDRAGGAAVRRAGDRLALRLLGGQPEGRDDRLVVGLEPDQGRVGSRQPARRLERPREHLVEVDRARDLAQEAASPALLLGPLDRSCELVGELVHAELERPDDLVDPLVGPPPRAADEQDEQNCEQQNAGAERRGDTDVHVRHAENPRTKERDLPAAPARLTKRARPPKLSCESRNSPPGARRATTFPLTMRV